MPTLPSSCKRLLLTLACILAISSLPASAARLHFDHMRLRGRVVAANASYVDIATGNRNIVIPAGLHPTCLVGSSPVALTSLTLGSPVLCNVPEVSGVIVGLTPGWVTIAEPGGFLVTLPISELPGGLLTSTDVQLIGPGDNLVTDSLSLALGLMGQGYAVMVSDPNLIYEPNYVDCGAYAFDGVCQQINSNNVVFMYGGTPLTVPVYGDSFAYNGQMIPLRSLRVGRRYHVNMRNMVGRVNGLHGNQMAIETASHQQISMPVTAAVRQSVPMFARLKSGHMVSAPVSTAMSFESHHRGTLLAPHAVAAGPQLQVAPGVHLSHPSLQPNSHLAPTAHPAVRHGHPAVTPHLHSNLPAHTTPAQHLHTVTPAHTMPAQHLHTMTPAHKMPAQHLHTMTPAHTMPAQHLHTMTPAHTMPAQRLHTMTPVHTAPMRPITPHLQSRAPVRRAPMQRAPMMAPRHMGPTGVGGPPPEMAPRHLAPAMPPAHPMQPVRPVQPQGRTAPAPHAQQNQPR